MTTARNPNGRAAAQAAPPQEPQAALLDQVVEATRYTVRDVETIATHVAKSRLYGLSEDQAFTLMMLAESEGLHPMQAVRRFHIIEGRPSMRADAMQAEFQRHGGKLRWLESTPEKCSAEFSHPVHHPEPITITVTMRELVDSEVAMQWPKRAEGEQFDPKRGKVIKDTYRKFPRQMLRARVISEGVRAVDPGVVVGIYTPEEVSDFEPPSQPTIPPNSTFRGFQSYNASKPLDSEVGNATPQPEPATAPARGECSVWVQTQIDDTENEWMSICAKEKKPHHHLGDKGKRLNVWQVVNGVVTDWLERGLIKPEAVQGDKGLRDRAKVLDMIKHEWAAEDDGEGLMADVLQYLRGKIDAAAQEAGINLDSEPAETKGGD